MVYEVLSIYLQNTFVAIDIDLFPCDSDVLLRHSRRHLRDGSATANQHDRGQDAVADHDDHGAQEAYTTPQVEGFTTPAMSHGFDSANGQQTWLGGDPALQHGHLNEIPPTNAFAVDPSLMDPPTNGSLAYQTSPSMGPASNGDVPFAYGFGSETFWNAPSYCQGHQLNNIEGNGHSEDHVLSNENVYSAHSRHPSLINTSVRTSWDNIDPELMSGWNGVGGSDLAPLNGDPLRSPETHSNWSVDK